MTCFRLSNGQTLYAYCRINNISYKTLFPYCDRDGLSPDEAVELYHKWQQNGTITNHRRGNTRLYYKDTPLIQFCRQNSLPYGRIIGKIRLGYNINSLVELALKNEDLNNAQVD